LVARKEGGTERARTCTPTPSRGEKTERRSSSKKKKKKRRGEQAGRGDIERKKKGGIGPLAARRSHKGELARDKGKTREKAP